MAAVAGACGGFVGTPGDMTNVRSESPENWKRFYFSTYSRCIARMKVSGLCLAKLIGYISRSAPTTCFKSSLFRMQNDMKLPPEQRRKYVLPISLEFIHHPILKTLLCATFKERHIMEIHTSAKKAPAQLTIHFFLSSQMSLLLLFEASWVEATYKPATDSMPCVWLLCFCFFKSSCLTATSTRSTGWRACTGRRVSGIFSLVLIGRLEGGDKSFNIID